METRRIAVLVGSLRKESYNKKTAKALLSLASKSVSLELVEIGDLPFYNEDLESAAPAEWLTFRERLTTFDAVLFLTPEYNRSVPAALKNALDVGSRPYGQSVWDGKPGAIISVSTGGIGGFGANHHLRQSLVFLNVPAMQQPEAYIGNAATLFDGDGNLINEEVRTRLGKFMAAFETWIDRNIPR